MVNRRSMSAAIELSPDKLAFIRGTAEQPASAPRSELSSQEPIDQPDAASAGSGVAEVKRPKNPRPPTRAGHLLPEADDSIVWHSNLLVPLTTRLQPDTAAALKRAALEQKLRGQKPGTVQEITEAALQWWLRDQGFPPQS